MSRRHGPKTHLALNASVVCAQRVPSPRRTTDPHAVGCVSCIGLAVRLARSLDQDVVKHFTAWLAGRPRR